MCPKLRPNLNPNPYPDLCSDLKAHEVVFHEDEAARDILALRAGSLITQQVRSTVSVKVGVRVKLKSRVSLGRSRIKVRIKV